MRILVTGSRDFTHHGVVRGYLECAVDDHQSVCDCGQITVVHGGCPRGADLHADRIARATGWGVEVHPADWSLGRGAGHIRNQRMVDLGAHLVLAFFAEGAANRGTADCVARATAAGIPVQRYPRPESVPPVPTMRVPAAVEAPLVATSSPVPPPRPRVVPGVCGGGTGPCGAPNARLFTCGWRCQACAPKSSLTSPGRTDS